MIIKRCNTCNCRFFALVKRDETFLAACMECSTENSIEDLNDFEIVEEN